MKKADDVQPSEPVRHGAYICLPSLPAALEPLADRLGFRNEFDSPDPPMSIAYLRRVAATPGDLADDGLLHAEVVIHVAAPTPEPVKEFCAELGGTVLSGVVRPMVYTGAAMFNYAYAHRVLQQPGPDAPNAFLLPMRKTDGWWAKDWMERHTYFLPRYDESGRIVHDGHARAAEAGIAALMRRTYKHPLEPAPAGEYDFLTYFECADDGVPVFHETCAALRDVTRNPEWAFVREGPTWHGRRVSGFEEAVRRSGSLA